MKIESAEHWHGLYLKRCQENQDDVARLGADVVALETERDALQSERDEAIDFIHRQGYRKCDIAACNCGSWHDTYLPWRLRFEELSEALNEAGLRPLEKTALVALQELIAERDALRRDKATLETEVIGVRNRCDEAEARVKALYAATEQGRGRDGRPEHNL